MGEHKIKYTECFKRGYHYGEVVNMVCIQKSCLECLTCCCACIEQDHKSHQTKPLKLLIRQAKQNSQKIKTVNYDIKNIVKIVQQNQSQSLQKLQNYRKQINTKIDTISHSIQGYYNSMIEQIKIKNMDPKVQLQKAFEAVCSGINYQDVKKAVKTIVSVLPNSQQNPQQVTPPSQFQLLQSLKSTNADFQYLISKNLSELVKNMQQFYQGLLKKINTNNIWTAPLYKFSQLHKHHNIKIVSDNIVKSINTSGYKFSVMEPGLEKGTAIQNYAFRVKQSTSNWVAVGMCHKNIVASKNYGFNFGGIGHGGYLISANGGSWSNTNAQMNNSIKSFKFIKNDVIEISVNFTTKKIQFKKSQEQYELQFKTIANDELYPCALFYYINDQIEFLPNWNKALKE